MTWLRLEPDPEGYYPISMIFRFQIEVAPDSWLDFGSAEGSGLHSVGSAIHKLVKAKGGTLEAGTYRYRPVDGFTHDWSRLTIASNRVRPGRLAESKRSSLDR
jgi:hypothetical protein